MAVGRTTYRKKATAKKVRGAGRRVYAVDGGYRISPECPRAEAKRRAVIKDRNKTRGPNKEKSNSNFLKVKIGWPDKHAPF